MQILGWREWVELPALNLPPLEAKVDTGAESSALHAVQVEAFRRRGRRWLRFYINLRAGQSDYYRCESPQLGERLVRNSSGQASMRPVIGTELRLMDDMWPIEVTLTDRESMQYRMLLGRNAVAGRFWVDPKRSFLAGRRDL